MSLIQDEKLEDDILLEEIEEEIADYEIEEIYDEKRKTNKLTSLTLYLNEIKNIPLLIHEEELMYGYDLKLIEKTRLFRNSEKEHDLARVFVSIYKYNYTKKDIDYIINTLITLFSYKSFNKDKKLIDIIKKYKYIYELKEDKLNPYELSNMYKEEIKNNILPDFEKINPIESNRLLKELNYNIKHEKAKEKLIESNLKLVVSIAKDHASDKIELEDLVAVGNNGLIKAIDRFDITLGYKFSTYATYWIRQSILKYINDNLSKVKYPTNFSKTVKETKMKIVELEKKHNRKFTTAELARRLNISSSNLADILMYDPYEASLDKSVNEDEDTSLGDLIESDSKNEIENIIINEELKKDVLDALETLNEQERKIIKLRFGIGDEKNIPHTLRETGKIMNISYERVRIVERKALNKLYVLSHENPKVKKLALYLEK